MQSKHYPFLLIGLFSLQIACVPPNNQSGLSEEERQYVDRIPDYGCKYTSTNASDLILEAEEIDIDEIYQEMVRLADQVLGQKAASDFQTGFRKRLQEHFFPFREELKEDELKIDNRNMLELANPKAYFESPLILHRELEWSKLIRFDEAQKTEIRTQFRKYSLEVQLCIDPDWRKEGLFKCIRADRSKEKSQLYGYDMNIQWVLVINVEHAKTRKLEHYEVHLGDDAMGYTLMDFEAIH